jgi:hypothetical protein
MTGTYLLRMNIPPSLEEEFVDALLDNPLVEGYQCYPTSGHGQVGAMSVTEQVAGRRNRVQFEVVLDADSVDEVLAGLKSVLPIADIIYWLMPIAGSGRFSDS